MCLQRKFEFVCEYKGTHTRCASTALNLLTFFYTSATSDFLPHVILISSFLVCLRPLCLLPALLSSKHLPHLSFHLFVCHLRSRRRRRQLVMLTSAHGFHNPFPTMILSPALHQPTTPHPHPHLLYRVQYARAKILPPHLPAHSKAQHTLAQQLKRRVACEGFLAVVEAQGRKAEAGVKC